MKSLDLKQMESYQGGELTPDEVCGIATGVGMAFIATGVMSWLGATMVLIAVGSSCGAV